MRLRLASALLLGVLLGCGDAPTPARPFVEIPYVPAGSSLLFYFDMKQLVASKGLKPLQEAAAPEKVLEAVGMDPFKELEAVMLALPGLPSSSDPPSGTVLMLRGSFDPDKVFAALSTTWKGPKLYSASPAKGVLLVSTDAATLETAKAAKPDLSESPALKAVLQHADQSQAAYGGIVAPKGGALGYGMETLTEAAWSVDLREGAYLRASLFYRSPEEARRAEEEMSENARAFSYLLDEKLRAKEPGLESLLARYGHGGGNNELYITWQLQEAQLKALAALAKQP